jgi:hypothetical protein
MLRIVMIHGCPLDLTAEVALDGGHEPAHVYREIELVAVLGRHDEPELVLLVQPWLPEDVGGHRPVRSVERAP